MGLFTGNTLYFPGCLTRYKLEGISRNYEEILKKAGVKFITLKNLEKCCGIPAFNAGYPEDFYTLVNKNEELLRNQNVSKIITNCPSCFRAFNMHYSLKAEHITKVIFDNLQKFQKKHNEKIAYHDPCELGRKSGIYDEPRAILREIGFEVVEMASSHVHAMCCGAGGGMRRNAPTVSARVAKLRLKEAHVNKIITTCPLCYIHLKEHAEGIEVLEFSEVLL
ncbi:MAG: (Fe-S)-binding protein [Candidatus Woesearchaeota archaeon]